MVVAKIDDIVKQIEELTVLEVADLVKTLEDKFGVTATAPVAVANTAVGDGSTGSSEEKDAYTVTITAAGDKKIGVIKAIRELQPDLGLKEAKDLVDNLPADVAENVKPEEAEEMKKKLEEAGAQVELK